MYSAIIAFLDKKWKVCTVIKTKITTIRIYVFDYTYIKFLVYTVFLLFN